MTTDNNTLLPFTIQIIVKMINFLLVSILATAKFVGFRDITKTKKCPSFRFVSVQTSTTTNAPMITSPTPWHPSSGTLCCQHLFYHSNVAAGKRCFSSCHCRLKHFIISCVLRWFWRNHDRRCHGSPHYSHWFHLSYNS